MEVTSSSAFYRGFMVKSIMNKASKSSKEKQKIPSICQSKILNISSQHTYVEESCMRPAIYLTDAQQSIRLFAMVCVWILFISACCNMEERERGEMFAEFACGMIADFVDSVFSIMIRRYNEDWHIIYRNYISSYSDYQMEHPNL